MILDSSTRLVLRDDVRLMPVADLEAEVRDRIDCSEDSVAVSRPGARSTSTVVDPEAAELLRRFEEPRTLIEALILYARPRGLDAMEMLDDALELVERFLQRRVLRVAEDDSAGDEAQHPETWSPGDRLELPGLARTAWAITPLAILEDVEVVQVRLGSTPAEGKHAVLKMRRPGAPALASLTHEAAILRHLDRAGGAPRLLAAGELEEREFLVLEWCDGRDAESTAAELRGPTGSRNDLLELLQAITRSYTELHAHGVLHGDVHPRNVLVSAPGSVRLIDFGLACRAEEPAPRRGGVGFFYEPEWARAQLAEDPPPTVTPAGEQYAVAALLYLLATGSHRRDFSLGREEMLAELAETSPLPFEQRGVEPWPELEEVLARALALEPQERFASMTALHQALEDVTVGSARRSSALRTSHLSSLEAKLLERLREGGGWLEEGLPLAPTASVNYGAAGIGLGLYRIAGRREDSRLLALAERWVDRATRSIDDASGFYRDEIDITPDTVGETSPFHSPVGIHAVRSLIARAGSDPQSQARALDQFLHATRKPVPGLDLTLGQGGQVLVTAFLLDSLPNGNGARDQALDPEPLLAFGRERLAAIWQELDAMGALLDSPVESLGVAHGWAGFLHLTFEWCRASGDDLPATLPDRLDELASLARPVGRGLRWPWQNTAGGGATMPGWCNGSAGYVPLWLHAYRRFGEKRFLTLAERAGWDCWDAPDSASTLCCGLTGRAWALLTLYRNLDEPSWLLRARALAERAATHAEREDEYPWSLYKGTFGLAVLAADLERPEESAQPFFESEGWNKPK